MSTLGIQPPQFKIPGNLNNLPKGLTSTLDPNKLKQLSPAQLDVIKNLPPEKLATLNTLPIDQIKNLDPKQLADKVSKLPNSNDVKNKLDKVGKQIKDRKDQEKKKAEELEKSLNDKKGFLKDQVKQSTKDSKAKLAALATPILLQFIRAENIADILIKKLEKDTKKQLQNKGTLTIDNGVFIFTPSNPGNYTIFKSNFDRRVSNIKIAINRLNALINVLTNLIKALNIALSLIILYIKIKTRVIQVKKTILRNTIRSITPPAIVPGVLQVELDTLNDQLDAKKPGTIANTEKKIETYQAVITSLQLFLGIFREMLFKIKTKIDRLQFTIINDSSSKSLLENNNDLLQPLSEANRSVPIEEEYISANGKSYILKLISLPNEQRQYQALDSFSKLKITQTAPSRVKTDAELLDEIKQILG